MSKRQWLSRFTPADQLSSDMFAAIRLVGGPIVIAAHPPRTNRNTIAGSAVIENSSATIWQLEARRCQISLSVTRVKGIGDGTKVSFGIEQVELEGKDEFDQTRTGAVVVKQTFAGINLPVNPLSEKEASVLTAMRDRAGASFKVLAGEVPNLTVNQIRRVVEGLEKRSLDGKG